MHGGVQVGRADSTSCAIIHVKEADVKLFFNVGICVGSVGLGLCEITGIRRCRAIPHLLIIESSRAWDLCLEVRSVVTGGSEM